MAGWDLAGWDLAGWTLARWDEARWDGTGWYVAECHGMARTARVSMLGWRFMLGWSRNRAVPRLVGGLEQRGHRSVTVWWHVTQ